MGRPPLDPGTYGSIRTKQLPSGVWQAHTLFRDMDGVTRPVKRNGTSEAAAKRLLKKALIDRTHASPTEITPDTSFTVAALAWLADVERRRRGTTFDQYRWRLHSGVLPAFGNLRLREISTQRFDQYLRELEKRHKPSTVRGYGAVVKGVMGYAVRMGALKVNPCNGAAPVEGQGRKPRALTATERVDFLGKLDAAEHNVPLSDVLRYMIGTGVRVGEALSLRWFRIDFYEGVAVHGDNLVRETGKGLVLHEPKSIAGFRVLPLPDFVVMMLRMRYPGEGYERSPVFADPAGKWTDPSLVHRAIDRFRGDAGYSWFTSHVCRRTAATILDEQNLSAREISGYIGHANPSFTQDRYMDRRPQSRAAGNALDAAMRPQRLPGSS